MYTKDYELHMCTSTLVLIAYVSLDTWLQDKTRILVYKGGWINEIYKQACLSSYYIPKYLFERYNKDTSVQTKQDKIWIYVQAI